MKTRIFLPMAVVLGLLLVGCAPQSTSSNLNAKSSAAVPGAIPVDFLTISDDGRTALAGGYTSSRQRFATHWQRGGGLAPVLLDKATASLSPDGKFMCQRQGELLTMRSLPELDLKWSKPVNGTSPLRYNPDGSIILCWREIKGERLSEEQVVYHDYLEALRVSDGKVLWSMREPITASRVRCVALSPSGKYVAIAGSDRAIRVRRVTTGETAALFDPIDYVGPIADVAFDADDTPLVVSMIEHSTVAVLYRREANGLMSAIQLTPSASMVQEAWNDQATAALSSDGRYLVYSQAAGGEAVAYRTETGRRLWHKTISPRVKHAQLDLMGGSMPIAVGRTHVAFGTLHGEVKVYELASGVEVDSFALLKPNGR